MVDRDSFLALFGSQQQTPQITQPAPATLDPNGGAGDPDAMPAKLAILSGRARAGAAYTPDQQSAIDAYDQKKASAISVSPGGNPDEGVEPDPSVYSPDKLAADNAAIAAKKSEIAAQAKSDETNPILHKVGVFGSGVNQGVANIAGLPVDLVNSALNNAGKNLRGKGFGAEQPVMGSDWIKQQESNAGLNDIPAQSSSDQLVKRTGEEIGGALLPLGASLGVGRILGDAALSVAPTMRTGAQRFAANVASAPGMTAARELGAATAGGATAGIADNMNPNSPFTDAAADIVGSLGIPTLAHGLAQAGRGVAGTVRTIVNPQAVGRAQAGIDLRNAATSPGAVAGSTAPSVAPTTGAPLTTFQATGDPGIGSLERTASEIGPGATGAATTKGGAVAATETQTAQNQAIRDALQRAMPTASDADLDTMQSAVSARLGTLGPNMTADTAGAAVRDTLQQRLDRLEQRRSAMSQPFYDAAANDTGFVRLRGARDILDGELETAAGQHADVMQQARGLLDNPDGSGALRNTMAQSIEADKALTDMLRDPALPPRSRVVIQNAQESMRRAMEQTSPHFRVARQRWRRFSEPINAMVGQGTAPTPTGNVLERAEGFSRSPYRVPNSGVISEFMNKTGPGAIEAAENLRNFGQPDIVNNMVGAWARDQLSQRAVNGVIDADTYRQFMQQYRDALRQFPAVESRIGGLGAAQQQVEQALAQRRLWGKMQKAGLDLTGERKISGAQIRKLVEDNMPALREAGLSPAQIDRLNEISNEVDLIDRSESATRATSGSDTAQITAGRVKRTGQALGRGTTRVLTWILGSGVGATLGGHLGLGEMGTAAGALMGDRIYEAIAHRGDTATNARNYWLTRAIFEPDVAKTLLMEAGPANEAHVVQRLRTHLLNAGHLDDSMKSPANRAQTRPPIAAPMSTGAP